MELFVIINLLKKNLTIFASLLAMFTSATFTYNLLASPKYEALSEVFVSTPTYSMDFNALNEGGTFAEKRIASYARLISSDANLFPVIESLGLDISAPQLARQIEVVVPESTVLLSIKATSDSSKLSSAIANAVAKQFILTLAKVEAPVDGSTNSVKATISRVASPPIYPTYPDKKMNLIFAAFAAIAFSFVIAGVREIFDSTVKTDDDLFGCQLSGVLSYEETFEQLPLISQLPLLSFRTEQYRRIRQSLFERPENVLASNKCKVVSVTSALPGEGKTTTCLNLGLSLSQLGFRILMVEADLRRPSFSNYFPVSVGRIGFSDILKMPTPKKMIPVIQEAIFIHEHESFYLEIISAGTIPPNPGELLTELNIRNFLLSCNEEYDFIFFDTAPVVPVGDSVVFGTIANQLLHVVKAGRTTRKQLLASFSKFPDPKSSDSVSRVILNFVPHHTPGDVYGYSAYGNEGATEAVGYGYGYDYGYDYGVSNLSDKQASEELFSDRWYLSELSTDSESAAHDEERAPRLI
jgi:succinoglycan biosynthesis transport protein ExoP